MLRQKNKQRKQVHNLRLARYTSIAAGMVNVASVIAFFAFTSNVTGHMAIFAEEIVKGHWTQVMIVFSWLFLFLLGAFTSNFLIHSLEKNGTYLAHAAPVILEIIVLTGIAFYGHVFYQDTLRETEYLIAGLLFAMGMQNSLVATISNGKVKTTHLTGLFTDLGMELSMYFNPKYKTDKSLLEKLHLHLVILGYYFGGGIIGGVLFLQIEFITFYCVSVVLLIVLYYDLRNLIRFKAQKKLKPVADKLIVNPTNWTL
jgi:uncharacterized membrane protein YoaK (UPF0700 family)